MASKSKQFIRSVIQTPQVNRALQGLAKRYEGSPIMDGLINVVTGIGTDRAKNFYNAYVDEPPLDVFELEALYANNDIAAVIVDQIVDDGLRDGFTIKRSTSTAEKDRELSARIMEKWCALQAKEQRFARGAKWGRLFGGGGVILGVKGAGALGSQLDDEKSEGLDFIKDVDRQQLSPNGWYADGRVMTYLYTPVLQGIANGDLSMPVSIHESRIMFFPGASTTANRRRENESWDLSVLQRVITALKSFDAMWANTDAMFADASQAVFHMQGLISALAEDGGKEDVRTRLALMDLFRSAAKAIVLDAGDETGAGKEDFKVVDRPSLGGLDGVQQNYMIRLATAARMPLTILLGMAPAGMDATGESDLNIWFGKVDAYRKQILAERILRLVKLMVPGLELDLSSPDAEEETDAALGAEPAAEVSETDDTWEWEIVWPELQKASPIDVATMENMRMTSALAAVTSEVATPEEVALSLNEIAPTLGLRIDVASRKKALKAALSEVGNREMGMGKAEAQGELATKQAVAVAKAKPTAGAPAGKMSARKTPAKAAKRQV